MFKRFWASLNYWTEVLGMDDPHGRACREARARS
jgi:hypothetical protein